MSRRKPIIEQHHTSTATDDDYDPESQTVSVTSSYDDDEVPELNFNDDNQSTGSNRWD